MRLLERRLGAHPAGRLPLGDPSAEGRLRRCESRFDIGPLDRLERRLDRAVARELETQSFDLRGAVAFRHGSEHRHQHHPASRPLAAQATEQEAAPLGVRELQALAQQAILLEHVLRLVTPHEEGRRDPRHILLFEPVHQAPERRARRVTGVDAHGIEGPCDGVVHACRGGDPEQGALAHRPVAVEPA